MRNGLEDLAARIARLDQRPGDTPSSPSPLADISHFISVLQETASPSTGTDGGLIPSPTEADTLQGASRLLNRLEDKVPEIVAGPLATKAQYWIRTGRPDHLRAVDKVLRRESFVGVEAGPGVNPSTKPFGIGLFTSTGVCDTPGMWFAYLNRHHTSTLHPGPWVVWRVVPASTACVCEIRSAADWVAFVSSHALPHNGFVYPDWTAVSRYYDAVHITLRAIAAVQGLSFTTHFGSTAPPYWDVECTFWLRWCFDLVQLVQTEGAPT